MQRQSHVNTLKYYIIIISFIRFHLCYVIILNIGTSRTLIWSILNTCDIMDAGLRLRNNISSPCSCRSDIRWPQPACRRCASGGSVPVRTVRTAPVATCPPGCHHDGTTTGQRCPRRTSPNCRIPVPCQTCRTISKR